MDLSTARHAFITGGASGLGLAIGDALARRGVAISLADIDERAISVALAERDSQFQGVALDTRDREAWRRAKDSAQNAFGPLDILVNNAGIGPDGRGFADMNPASFDRMMAINLTGVFNGVWAFAADLRAQGRGHVVNTASIAGLTSGMPMRGAYSAAKAGVVGLSEVLRAELAPHGVGVSTLCPGLVPTNLGATTAKLGGVVGDPNATMPDVGISASMVAERVVQGIERNSLYIVTHADNLFGVESRAERLRAAFQTPVPIDLVAHLPKPRRFQHAFVTGGASGIGLAIADALLAEGVFVTIADLDEAALEAVAAERSSVKAVRLDVADREAWRAAKAMAEAALGPVDILVNNAGIATDGRGLADVDPAFFDKILAIDLVGVFNGVSAFGADMRARGRGHIVNTASIVGLAPSTPTMGAYAAAKCGVVALSEALRSEMAPHGVGVSCLCPGYVATKLRANTRKAGGGAPEHNMTRAGSGLSLPLVGACVLRGIAENLSYIITHPAHWPSIEGRLNTMAAAFHELHISGERHTEGESA